MDLMNQAEENKYSEILTLDKDNEDKAIGYILDNEEAALLAVKLINEQSFVCNYNAHIFKLLRVHLGDGKPLSEIYATINSITSDDWKEISPNQDVEKNKHISHCRAVAISLFGSSALAEGLFNKINKQFVRREMLSKYTEAKQSLLNTDGIDDISHVVHNVSEKTNDMLDSIATGTFDKNYADSLLETLNRKEESKISTGYKKLDEIIEGFGAGQLVTIGAGTGRGKSAFAVNLALNIRDQDYTVGLWSFEMDEHEVKERILSNVTGIGKKDEYRQEERYNLVRKYADKISSEKAGIKIFTDRIIDLGSFYLNCRRLSIRNNMKVIIIDYLQLIHLSGFTGQNRTSEVEHITKTFKSIASELGITIIILSQLSRDYQKRADKTPILSDLRDSGSIEQDSNIVIFLHRLDDKPSYYKKWQTSIRLIVEKNRSGMTGKFFMKYDGILTKFTETDGDITNG